MTQYSPGGLNLLTPLRLAYDDSGTTDVLFAVNSAGELTITPVGGKATVVGVFVRSNSAGYWWSAQGQAAISVAGTPVKVSTSASTTSIRAENFTVSTNNRATYTGAETQTFRVSYAVTMTGETNKIAHLMIAKNGTVIAGSAIHRKLGTGTDEGALSVEFFVELATNDYVELWATNEDGTGDIFVEHGTCIITEA